MPGDGGDFFRCFLILRMGRVKPGKRRSARLSSQNYSAAAFRQGSGGSSGQEPAPALVAPLSPAQCPSRPPLRVPLPEGGCLPPLLQDGAWQLDVSIRPWSGTGLTLSPRGVSQPAPRSSPSFSWCLCTSDKNLPRAMGLQHLLAPRGPLHVDTSLSSLAPWPKLPKRVGLYQGTTCGGESCCKGTFPFYSHSHRAVTPHPLDVLKCI